MLDSARPLARTQLGSTLGGQSRLRPGGGRTRRSTITALMLTSLVDAFSILVIFLIMTYNSSPDSLNTGKVALPQVGQSEYIQSGVVVRIENNLFMVDEKPVALAQLAETLKALNTGASAAKKDGLILVADRNLDYEAMSPVILAGSNAGFTKFKFAVIRK